MPSYLLVPEFWSKIQVLNYMVFDFPGNVLHTFDQTIRHNLVADSDDNRITADAIKKFSDKGSKIRLTGCCPVENVVYTKARFDR